MEKWPEQKSDFMVNFVVINVRENNFNYRILLVECLTLDSA